MVINGEGVTVFRGVNALNLDAKGRMAMPTKYRERLKLQCNGQLVITVDPAHCLLLFPLPVWEEIERQLVNLPNLDKKTRRIQRLYIGHATECELDGQNRILLPPQLRDFAALDKRVVLIGQGKKFELWDEQAWNEQRDKWLALEEEDQSLPAELETISL